MNIPLLSKLFGKQKRSLQSLDSILVSKLKKFAKENEYPLFENTPIFYRSEKMIAQLVLFIPKTGLILFEYKDWSYEELRNAKVSKSSHVAKSENSLSFESLGEFIKEKFIDLTNFDDIDIFNFVIMEQLKEEEFNLLDKSFHELLPKERVLFQNSTPEILAHKFKTLQPKQKTYTIHNTLPFIFSQYMILEKNKIHFADEHQRMFIDKELQKTENIAADRQSGKSILLLQKAIFEKLKHPHTKIAIIAVSHLQKELLSQTLLDLVERSSVVLDMNDIAIYTPSDIQNTQKRLLESADMIFFDDAFLMEESFLDACRKLQKNRIFVFVNVPHNKATVTLPNAYYGTACFICADEFPTLMKKIYSLLQDEQSDALIFTNDGDFEAIKEDIENYSAQKLSFLSSDDSLHNHTKTRLQLCNYDIKIPLHATYSFLIQGCRSDYAALEYLAKSARTKSFIIYEEECDNIHQLKKVLERKDVEDTQK